MQSQKVQKEPKKKQPKKKKKPTEQQKDEKKHDEDQAPKHDAGNPWACGCERCCKIYGCSPHPNSTSCSDGGCLRCDDYLCIPGM